MVENIGGMENGLTELWIRLGKYIHYKDYLLIFTKTESVFYQII